MPFIPQLYDIAKAKDDHKERVANAENIKNSINKTFNAVCDANAVLQVVQRVRLRGTRH